MKEPISVSEDDYNGAIQNFLFWLTRQEIFKEKMDKDKVSSLVFQVRWDFVKTNTERVFFGHMGEVLVTKWRATYCSPIKRKRAWYGREISSKNP